MSKTTSRERFASRRGSTPRSPLRFRWEPQRASRVGEHDGADGDRTHDLRLAKPALSRLSYSPETWDVAEAASPNGPEGRPQKPREAPRAYPLTFGFDPAPVPLLSSGCCPPLILGFPYSFRRAGDQACYLSPPKVGPGRVELPTSPLSGVRSNQLSYRPSLLAKLVELVGIEPATS